MALRQSLIELSNSRSVQHGQETKMEQVYQYLTGMKFRQRVEAVIEKFKDMREDLDREQRFMGKQWSKRDAQILPLSTPRSEWWATCRSRLPDTPPWQFVRNGPGTLPWAERVLLSA